MGIDTEGVVMFSHVGLVVVGMMLGGVMHTALIQVRRSNTVAEMRPWVGAIRLVEPLLPIVALAVLGTGAWLIELSDGEFKWGQGWVVTSVVALFLAEGVGGSLVPQSHALTSAIGAAPEGPVPIDLRRRALAWPLWFGSHFTTAVFFGIIFLMTTQPSGTWAPIATIVVASLIGLFSAIPFVRSGRTKLQMGRGAPQPTG